MRGRPSVGRGPKGCKRSDERIREELSEQLAQRYDLDASEIEVRVENGEVTLSGTVDDRSAKRMAEDLAESIFGVSEVHNHIRVQRGGTQGTSNTSDQEVNRSVSREGSSGGASGTSTGSDATRSRGRTGSSGTVGTNE